MPRGPVHAVGVALALLTVACGRLPMGGKDRCSSNADCHAGRLCTGGVCQESADPEVPCGPDLECTSGLTCCGGRCVAYAPARWPDRAALESLGSASGDASGARLVFAVDTLNPGIGDEPGDGRWQDVGLDLDCRRTSSHGIEVSCTPVAGAGTNRYADGDNGLDNGFGRSIGPTLAALTARNAAPETTTNQAIADGRWTLLLELNGYSGGASDPDVTVRLSPSPGRSETGWILLPRAASGGRVFEFDEAYVTGETLVAKARVLDFMMQLDFRSDKPQSATLHSWIDTTLYGVVLTLDLDGYPRSVDGLLGAAWRQSDLEHSLVSLLYDVGICQDEDPDSGYAVTVDKVRDAIDLRLEPDVSAQPAGPRVLLPCQAASFGLRFVASAVGGATQETAKAEAFFDSSCQCAFSEDGAVSDYPPERCWSVVNDASGGAAGAAGGASSP